MASLQSSRDTQPDLRPHGVGDTMLDHSLQLLGVRQSRLHLGEGQGTIYTKGERERGERERGGERERERL